jgi:hypothetical protein
VFLEGLMEELEEKPDTVIRYLFFNFMLLLKACSGREKILKILQFNCT